MIGKKNTKPLVSVIMPVFNPGKFLSPAIDSILNQTYRQFELIIVDDSSTDNSWKTVKKYAKADKRIKVFQNPQNMGVSVTSNFAISQAQGDYITRMDSDDISPVYRLERQVKYLQSHPKTIAVGGQCVIINYKGEFIGAKNFPIISSEIHDMLFWAVPIQQGCTMINRTLLPPDFEWYTSTFRSAEEINLIFRLTRYGQIANVKDVFPFYRHLSSSLSHKDPKTTFWLTLNSRLKAIRNGHQPSFKAVCINLAQIPIITLLPNSLINQLWYYIRGVKQIGPDFSLETLPFANVKSN